MYTEGGGRDKSSKHRQDQAPEGTTQQPQQLTAASTETTAHPTLRPQHEPSRGDSESPEEQRKPHATEPGSDHQQEEDTKPPASDQPVDEPSRPRQVIAVSASKGPAAFFNLARKFLATDEVCDLSALEGAIVSAVDAAHLLERSKLATIVRVSTSYVTVEPKRKKQKPHAEAVGSEAHGQQTPSASVSSAMSPGATSTPASAQHIDSTFASGPWQHHTAAASSEHLIPPSGRQKSGAKVSGSGGRERELRRARIVITVRRTEEYRAWLEENPLQAIIAGDGDDDENVEPETTPPPAKARTRQPP